MPAYTSGSTQGSGTLGTSAMNASTTYTFTITNNSDLFKSGSAATACYLTLEGNSNANQALDADQVITGAFASFTGTIASGSRVERSTGFSIPIAGAGGTFTFTPTTTIVANKYFIKTTGHINVDIS